MRLVTSEMHVANIKAGEKDVVAQCPHPIKEPLERAEVAADFYDSCTDGVNFGVRGLEIVAILVTRLDFWRPRFWRS